MRGLDLNCDLGEGGRFDGELMPLITSANIACAGHAGDLTTAVIALASAKRYRVQVGAHPGFMDREHFGRRELNLSANEIRDLIILQVEFLRSLEDSWEVRYIKPHGALYNMACRDDRIARPVIDAAVTLGLPLLALPNSRLEELSRGRIGFIREGFADRRYWPDGSLVPRDQPDAFIETPEEAVQQALALVEKGVQSICVHGDNPESLAFVRALREGLTAAGVTIEAFSVR
ncbi:MAG: LamB/YcsF family protein [Planctomycetia bacterium]|nr:LamB/YcsF family protein [Planctomycetia bacterium]